MKAIALLLNTLLLSTAVSGQYQLAGTKPGLKTITVYDSSSKLVTGQFAARGYFYVKPAGKGWYYMPDEEGVCRAADIQLFAHLSNRAQRNRFNGALTRFYKVCEMGNIPHVDTTGGGSDTTYYPPWQAFYDDTVEVLLSEFITYYQRTKDTATLRRVLQALRCGPDGSFAEVMMSLVGQCYDWNKKLFIRMVRNIGDKEEREQAKGYLLHKLTYFYQYKYRYKPAAEAERLAQEERDAAAKALQ